MGNSSSTPSSSSTHRENYDVFEVAFSKHENELQHQDVKKWGDALTQAFSLSGWDSSVTSMKGIQKVASDVLIN
ncbi:hypothetical protein Ddye_030109 [Dipteronia dyeriana]|uniref:Uncharacterized protein n=1 Tax=Dipteronia dyeriana TaxID=168575 RepID=A0AAD9TFU5_9ROSI|nr:hypothetical protein Ddye_030109 [Dipteronia dyeriana]